MTVVEAVRARLLSRSEVTTLVGQRVYTLLVPQNNRTWPVIRLQQIGTTEALHLRGVESMMRARVQVDAYADASASTVDPYAQAHAVAEAAHGSFSAGVATGLAGWTGTIGSPAFTVACIEPLSQTEMYEADEFRLVRVTQDYWVWFLRT